MRVILRLLRDDRAAGAAEFAIVLPLLIVLLLGIVDAGRYMWEFNRAEKATQMGVRYAVVTDPVLNGLSTYSFAVAGEVQPGDPVTTNYFDHANCTSASCSCVSTAGGFCSATSLNSTAFSAVVARMAAFYPPIVANDVEVDYKNVGLGFSGDPNGPDVEALVTVKLRNLNFQPITCLLFGCSVTMPNFSAALTLEDASNNGVNPPRAN